MNVLNSLANFKQFLRLDDKERAFDNAKINGYVGLPALSLENGRIIIDQNELAKAF